ncbi:Uncharacterised protein [Mycobacterium tuberculosis]|nr:Uncharacterised protein [Mycobacterium tuberculosis]
MKPIITGLNQTALGAASPSARSAAGSSVLRSRAMPSLYPGDLSADEP